jgi:hypothetical protein
MAKNNKQFHRTGEQKNGNLSKSKKSQKQVKEKQYIIEETLEMRLDACIQKVKDLSELIIGYTPYTLNFSIDSYKGTTNKPSKVSAFANAVVGIILADGQSSFSHIGSILGLNVDIDIAERKMLENAIKQMLDIHLLEGDESAYNVTEQGKTFAEHGEKMEPYPSNFSVWYLSNHKSYANLRNDLNEDFVNDIEITEDQDTSNTDLSLDEIKGLAEIQANHAHSSKDRFLLQEATKTKTAYKSYELIACFIRSVKTKEVRVLLYDDNSRKVLPELSAIVDSDDILKKNLYEAMLGCTPDVEVLDEKDAIISKEQILAEEDLLKAEENISEQTNDKQDAGDEGSLEKRLHKRALYDSISFETEIHTIFQKDNADEIWLSSPWVGDDAFMQSRLPLIQEFIKKGGCVFISYSEGTNGLDSKKQMVGWQSNKAIQQMAIKYPGRFFYSQFEAFHSKNVIEVKNGQCILFTGSFNVLSFHVIPSQKTHIRKEEMALAHYQVAENKYKEFKKQFAMSYIKRAIESFDELNEKQILSYKNESLDFFRKDPELAVLFAEFDEKLDELQFSIRNKQFESNAKGKKVIVEKSNAEEKESPQRNILTKEEFVAKMQSAAKRHIEAELVDENAIYRKLASLCYASIGDNAKEMGIQDIFKREVLNFLLRVDVLKAIKYCLFKGKIEGTTQIAVFMKDYRFGFHDIELTSKEFFTLYNKRSVEVEFKNYSTARMKDLSQIIIED